MVNTIKRRDISDLGAALDLFGRQTQFQEIIQALTQDKDVLIVGVPGSGRRTLVKRAANTIGTKIIEIDCIRATDGKRFVQLLWEGIKQACKSREAANLLQKWAKEEKELFCLNDHDQDIQMQPICNKNHLWRVFIKLLELPKLLTTYLHKSVLLILHGFPHIRAWDRQGEWERVLREEIQRQKTVSYVLVATIAETSHPTEEIEKNLEIVQLPPLANEVVAAWAQEALQEQGLAFDPRSQALPTFLEAVQGHMGDATALMRRLQTARFNSYLIGDREINQVIQILLADSATIFESLLMLLPASQLQLLESLALDPTDKPQSRCYINKHCLSRGGSLQGALIGLQHKGLIYGSELGYRLALPLFALWIRQRLK